MQRMETLLQRWELFWVYNYILKLQFGILFATIKIQESTMELSSKWHTTLKGTLKH